MRTRSFFATAVLLSAVALVATGIAWAGDDAADKPAPATSEAPATAPLTATPSPIHTMLKWVGSQVMEGDAACPSTEQGEKAWRAWFAKSDGPLAGLRAAMMKDGWNADRTIGFFKQMAAAQKGDCGGCDKTDGKCCGNCDKSKGAAAPAGDAGQAGDAASGCCKGKCKDGGCDKSKCKDGGCDKAKGAAAPAGDAGKTGDAAPKCPCTGKPQSDCSGCGKDSCPCGKDKAPANAK